MARKIPKSFINRNSDAVQVDDPVLQEARSRHSSGATDGGAWMKAGAVVMSSELEKLQKERLKQLLSGDLVILLSPDQIEDEVGTDRSTDWMSDEAFQTLKSSIEMNGQDVPIQVAPVDPEWAPVFNETDGVVTGGVKFKVIGGRRRLEAVRQLGQKVRAVCVQVDRKQSDFDQLHRRYRENTERENLTLFDELMAIGELFSHAKTLGEKITGRSLAKMLNVSEAKISKARAIYDNRERISAEVPEPHRLTLHQLDEIIPALRAGKSLPKIEGEGTTTPVATIPELPAVRKERIKTLKRTQVIRGRKIVAKARNGKITLDLGDGTEISETFLDRILLFLQTEQGKT